MNYQNEHYTTNDGIEKRGKVAKSIPVKTHFQFIENELADLKNCMDKNLKDGIILRSQLLVLDGKVKENCKFAVREFINDLTYLKDFLNELKDSDEKANTLFDANIKELKEERDKINDKIKNCDQELKNCEASVGIGLLRQNYDNLSG